jgi:hypothetical protein
MLCAAKTLYGCNAQPHSIDHSQTEGQCVVLRPGFKTAAPGLMRQPEFLRFADGRLGSIMR